MAIDIMNHHQCGNPNHKPTTWGWFCQPICGDIGDGLWRWVYHINCGSY